MERLDGECSSYSQGVHNRTVCDLDVNRQEYESFQDEDILINIRTPNMSLGPRRPMNQWGEITKGPESYSSSAGGGFGGRFNFLYHGQGASNYNMNSYCEQGESARDLDHDLDWPPGVENLENCRAELLRKLDELKDQVSWSCDVTENPKGRTGTGQRVISTIPSDPYPRNHAVQEGLIRTNGLNKQPLAPDDMASSFLSQALWDSYPQRGHPHEFLTYDDTYQQEMFQRPPRQPHSQYMHRPHPEHFHDYYGDVLPGLLVSHPATNFSHQPVCSCVHCCNKNWYLPPKIDPSCLYNQKSRNELSNPSCRHLYPIQHMPLGYSSRGSNLHASHSRQSLTLSSTDLDSENHGTNHNSPRKVVVAHRDRQVWHPIAGGAPIIACCNCFELLELPRRRISLTKNQQKLKCGACSSIILFELGHMDSSVPVSGNIDHVSTEVGDGSSVKMDENIRYHHGGSNFSGVNACSNDYGDFKHKVSLANKKSDSAESEKQLDPLSPALCEDGQMPEAFASGKHSSPSAERVTEVESFLHPHLSSEECLDHCSVKVVFSQFGKEDNSKRSEFERNISWLNSVGDSAVATEADMSDEFSNSGVSRDSEAKSKEYYPISNKDAESFFPGLKNSSEFTETTQNVEVGRSQFGKGDNSKRSEFDRNITLQNSVGDSAVSTEMDMSLDEFSNSGVSRDSEDKSKEHHPISNKDAESFFSGLKNSSEFTESMKNVEVVRSQVSVNGNLIPEHLVKKAEKLAGPIQPGEYWYDVHAGFWGVMGHPCLGIIMPNIEEFNFPMPENCAAGNTGVFVNGRELHLKDLDLLAHRGLPDTRHGSYLVEISGKVVDEHTGEELHSLGRLAPTVEKAKHGFGMKVPRFIARLQS